MKSEPEVATAGNGEYLPAPVGVLAPLDPTQPQELSVFQVPFGQGRLHNKLFPCQLKATTDGEAVLAYVNAYCGDAGRSAKTRLAYLREVELFLRWAVYVRGESLSNLMYEDMASYRTFLAEPPADWIASGKGHYNRKHPNYRPFRGPRTAQNIAYTMTILQGMFKWLQDKGWLAANVIRGNGWTRSPTDDSGKPVKYLPPDVRHWVAKWLDHEARKNEARLTTDDGALPRPEMEKLVARRRRQLQRFEYLFEIGYYLLLRRADLSVITMGSFKRDSMKEDRWTWTAVRKRGKTTTLVAAPAAIERINRYRASYGMASLPAGDDDRDLSIVLSLTGDSGLGPDRIYELYCDLFAGAADFAEAHATDAATKNAVILLREATPHWLRHSAITDLQLGGAATAVVRDLAGHDDAATTNAYTHSDHADQERAFSLMRPPLAALVD